MTVVGGRAGDLERENAELRRQLDKAQAHEAAILAERDEALAQQTATAEVLQVINSSTGDLAPVFDAMLEKAMRLCEAAFGGLWIFGDRYIATALRGVPQAYADFLHQSTEFPGPGTAAYRFLHGERSVIHNVDLANEEAYLTGQPLRVALVDLGGARTAVQVPLLRDDGALGLMTIYRQEVRPFSDKQIALLQNFAAQAVIAMENARLLTETREALEQQTATAEVLGVINASPGDVTPVFDTMLQNALRLCGADLGNLLTFNGECFEATVGVYGTAWVGPERESSRTPFRPVPGGLLDRLVGGEHFMHTEDVRTEISYQHSPEFRQLVDGGGYQSMTHVALRKADQLLGAIVIFFKERRRLTDKQIAVLQNFAAQAVIAIENARLITETREALEQQTATAEVLGVINASPGNLTPVFDAVLEKALNLCGAAVGVLQINDGDRFRTAATRGVPAAYAEYRKGHSFIEGPGSLGARIRAGERVVHVLDLKDDEPYKAGDANRVPLVDLGGARTGLAVPLSTERGILGFIIIYRHEVRAFSDKQIALLQNFAAQAVIAMENARLISETREALEQQTATAEVLGVINASPGDLAPVFEAMLEKALHLCGAAFGMMNTYDGERFHRAADYGVPPAYAGFRQHNQRAFSADTAPGRILAGEDLVHNVDLKAEEAYERGDPNRRALVDLGGARSHLAVALRKDARLLGHIGIYRQEVRPFTDKQIALLKNFAAEAVIAIENARLLSELRQRTEEVAELNRGLKARVAEAVDELGRVGRLKRFLAPQLAELIVSQGDEKILESHRREIVVVFCDLRGYTAFTETAEPEEVLDFLREYHGALGPLVSQFEGTLDQFSGDGIMVFFNDPVPIPDAAERAVKMAVAMREAAGALIAAWRERGRELGFGAGIAQGYATLGQIGFSERSGYTAIGTVCNVAARLCGEAKDGQILLSQRVNAALKGSLATEQLGALALKGLTQPVIAFNVPFAANQPALRVIEGGPPTD